MDIAYALAADQPSRVSRLVVAEAVLPGVTPFPPLVLPQAEDERAFHFMFNKLPTMNAQLVRGGGPLCDPRSHVVVARESGGQAMPNDSTRTVLVAIGADLGVALAKVGTAAFTGVGVRQD